jgi:hypothetical protein
MEAMTQQTKPNNARSKYRDRIRLVSESVLPPPTEEEIEWGKDPDAQYRRELRKLWKAEMPDFKRLERLARDLKIKRVIVTPDSPSSILGRYLSEGYWDSRLQEEWGLSEKRDNSIGIGPGATILICRDTVYEEGACRFLAHEIGHHICSLANFTLQEQNASAAKVMRRFFPENVYLKNRKSREEFRAECFAEYLTLSSIRRGIERECEKILSRVRRHYPDAAKLITQYRTTLLERTS